MSAIETLIQARGTKAEPTAAPREKNGGPGDEFEQAMTDALAPGEKKIPGKTGVAEKTRLAPTVPLPAAKVTTVTAAPNASVGENADGAAASFAAKKKPAAPLQKNSADLDPASAAWFPSGGLFLPAPDFSAAPTSGVAAKAKKSAPVADHKIAATSTPPAKTDAGTSAKPNVLASRSGMAVSEAVSPIAISVSHQLKISEPDQETSVEVGVPTTVSAKVAPPKLIPENEFAEPSKKLVSPASEKAATADATNPAYQRTLPTLENVAFDEVNEAAPVGADKTATPEALPVLPVLPAPQNKPEVSDVKATLPVTAEKADAAILTSRVSTAPVVSPPDLFSPPETGAVSPPAEISQATDFNPLVSTSSQAVLNAPEKITPEKIQAVAPLVDEVITPAAMANGLVSDSAPITVSHDLGSVRGKMNSERSTVASAAAANSGTGVASILPVMKNNDKMDFLAGSAGQKLPGVGPARSAENAWPVFLKDSPQTVAEKYSTDFNAPLTGADNFSASPATATTTVNVLAQPLSNPPPEMVERTHELVATHALRLVESKADSLSVVLKPAAGTELSLQLRHKDGIVEASAVLAQGDHQLLNAHWSDLQAQLELRGVKLGPLGGEGNSSAGQDGQQRSPTREEAADQAAAFAEFAVVSGSVGGAGARHAPAMRGWESWA